MGRSGRRKARPRRGKKHHARKGHAAHDSARGRLQRLIATMPDAVVTVRASGALGDWSASASRITGRGRREVQRRGLASLFRDPQALDAVVADIEGQGRVTDQELILVNTAGEDVPIRVFGTKLPVEPGAASGNASDDDPERYLLVLHDLTEVHRIRRRLIETEKLSAMAKIAGSVAHEFRNPLNSLFLSTDLLEDELEGRKEIRTSIAPTLAAIREEIERLNQIITHYLSLSKIATSEPEVIDLGLTARDFASEWEERAGERDVQLRVRPDDNDHRISADPDQVRRILVNLVENAFDALGDRGENEDGRRAGTVTLLVRRMRRSVKLTVKDNGPGIPEDIRDRVFEPFFTSKTGGSGLGLYLVREIVLAAGASMSLSSSDKRGTSVSVRWPVVEDEEGAS